MSAHSSRIQFPFLLALTVLFALLPLGCGGGTSGTGDNGGSTVYGKVLTVAGQAVEGATVIIAETGDSGVTDATGAFQFNSELNGRQLTFIIEKNTASARTVLDDAPQNPGTLYVEFSFDEALQIASITRYQVDPGPTPTPTPEGPGLIPGETVLCRINLYGYPGVLDGVVVRSNQRGVAPQTFVKLGENDALASWGVLMRIPKSRGSQTFTFQTKSTLFTLSLSKIDPSSTLIQIDGGLFPRGSDDPKFLRYVGAVARPAGAKDPQLDFGPRAPD